MDAPAPTPRLLLGMVLGTVIAVLGALFLGEYEFDEWLPIGAGVLLGYLVAEIVVSVGKHRSPVLAAVVATWAFTAVLLAGHLDANGVDAVKVGAYVSAVLSAAVAAARANRWRRREPVAS